MNREGNKARGALKVAGWRVVFQPIGWRFSGFVFENDGLHLFSAYQENVIISSDAVNQTLSSCMKCHVGF